MSNLFGVIAEDQSDIDVIELILSKYFARNKFSMRKFVGNGCGKVRSKCESWAQNLFLSGCNHVFIFHDLDRNDETKLREILLKKVPAGKFPNSLVVIPREELEAWLLADSGALKDVFGLTKAPKKIADCESVNSPKEFIRDLVWNMSKKTYLNTVHNKKIAEKCTLTNLRRCKSFKPLDEYLLKKVVVL